MNSQDTSVEEVEYGLDYGLHVKLGAWKYRLVGRVGQVRGALYSVVLLIDKGFRISIGLSVSSSIATSITKPAKFSRKRLAGRI